MDAAAALFAERGYSATSMRDIASAVEMLPGSIYYHFASKDDLLLAIYEAGVTDITEALEGALMGLHDPWARLEAGMAALVEAVTQPQARTRVIFAVTPDQVPRHREALIAARDAFEVRFSTLIDDLPLAPWVDRQLLKLMLLGAGNHAQLWYSESGSYRAEEIGKAFARFVRAPVEH